MAKTSKTSKRINELASEVYSLSVRKGFWIIDEISEFAIVPVKLALIGDEVSEALKVHREEYTDSEENLNHLTVKQEEDLTEELADIIIRTLDLAGGLDLNIGESIMKKIEKNYERPHRHGKRY